MVSAVGYPTRYVVINVWEQVFGGNWRQHHANVLVDGRMAHINFGDGLTFRDTYVIHNEA